MAEPSASQQTDRRSTSEADGSRNGSQPEFAPATTLASDPREVRPLTGLRLFAAAWVVVFHFQFTGGELLARVLDPVFPLVNTGAMGVDLFYVLSGFVIAFTYLGKLGPRLRVRTAGRFLWARVCRIWPVYALVTTAFGAFLLFKLIRLGDTAPAYQDVQPALTVGSWLNQLAMVQMWPHPWHDGMSWVGPAWSISAEWLAYVLFPVTALLFYRLRKAPRWLLGPAAVLLMAPVATLCLVSGSPYFPFSWMARVLAGFAAGVLVYLVVREIPRTARVRRVASWVSWLVLAAVLAGLWWGDSVNPGPAGTERGGIVLLLFPLLVGALALADRGPARVLSTRWSVHGGRISYSLYLVHVPLFEVLWTFMHRTEVLQPDTPLATVLTPVAFIATFALAHALYKLVEEPARRALRRR
ncbi:acyltransferase family protein [Pseudonocardia acaciae]|uniref:acyltransferase family protein n=1 Tax=Pseudonocardia acaciae TaxID=551276 RepID=UPI000685B805|nr:acyltransferase [Pseudonocardia acaciae]